MELNKIKELEFVENDSTELINALTQNGFRYNEKLEGEVLAVAMNESYCLKHLEPFLKLNELRESKGLKPQSLKDKVIGSFHQYLMTKNGEGKPFEFNIKSFELKCEWSIEHKFLEITASIKMIKGKSLISIEDVKQFKSLLAKYNLWNEDLNNKVGDLLNEWIEIKNKENDGSTK